MSTRKSGTLILILLVVCITLIVVDQVAGWGLLKGAWAWLFSPLQHGLHEQGEEINGLWARWREAGQLQEENEQLRELVGYLTSENHRYQEIKRENEELRQLLGLQQRYPDLVLLHGEVIGRDPASVRQILRVGWAPLENRTIEVQEGMPVISAAGLVGRVIEVYPNAADVLLITDISSSVSAKIQNEDEPTGIVDGRWQAGRRLRMRFIPQGSLVQEGDWVVTSGLQQPPFKAFPPGLLIGQILHVEISTDMHQEVELVPSVDIDHLDWVSIVVGTR